LRLWELLGTLALLWGYVGGKSCAFGNFWEKKLRCGVTLGLRWRYVGELWGILFAKTFETFIDPLLYI
jgi:hypothetical protein